MTSLPVGQSVSQSVTQTDNQLVSQTNRQSVNQFSGLQEGVSSYQPLIVTLTTHDVMFIINIILIITIIILTVIIIYMRP